MMAADIENALFIYIKEMNSSLLNEIVLPKVKTFSLLVSKELAIQPSFILKVYRKR